MLILVVFHKQLPSCLERIPLRIIWQFLLCSQFSTPVSAWSLSSPFPPFSLPQIAWQKKPIMWGPLPLVLKLSVLLKSHCRPGGGRGRSCGKAVISEGKFNHTTSTWSYKSVLQWSCLTTAAKVWQSKLLWCSGIISAAQGANEGQFNLLECILWKQQ